MIITQPHQLAPFIDHTILKADATVADVQRLCAEAREYGFAAVCINPWFVSLAAETLRGSTVKVCTVAGFPLGASTTEVKTYEAVKAAADGAHEVDMVLNLPAMRSGRPDEVERDIAAIVQALPAAVHVKVILETCYLDEEQIRLACRMAVRAGARFVKTSTGFGPAGATVEAVRIMREVVGPTVGVKAAGGIRDFAAACAMIAAGADRIGCSAGVAIMQGK